MSIPERSLTRGHKIAVGAAILPMVAAGAFGARGTYTNMRAAFPGPTAAGVVAAGEGATLVLAVLLAVLTMFGQPYPAAARLGLWALPGIASFTGLVVADSGPESVVYAMTPLAMSVSGEGLGFLIRRVVVYRTGLDAEAQRRNAATMQKLAYHRARAANHPGSWIRKFSERTSWRLAKKVGAGDTELGSQLITVQRERMSQGADAALAGMFALPVSPVSSSLGTAETPTRDAIGTAAPDAPALPLAETPVSEGDTQVETVPDPVVTGSETGETGGGETAETPRPRTGASVAEIAAVLGVAVPETGVSLDDDQLSVVLRHLRYSDDPPMSYRQALGSFRDAGYVGSEARVRRAWGLLVSGEEVEA